MTEAAKTRVNGAFPMLAHRSARPDDYEVVRRAQRGDTAAFEKLVQNYDRTVLRLALHLTGSPEDAQDIYQEAFLRAYRNLGRFRFECSFYTWLYRIVVNLCLDHARKNHNRKKEISTDISEDGEEGQIVDRMADYHPGANPERTSMNLELRRCILAALCRLSPRERVVFELRHYQGMKLRTVAILLNTTENTIKNTLFRATRKLRAELANLSYSLC